MQSDEQNGLLVASFSLGLLGLLTTLLVNIVIQSLDRPTGGLLLPGPAGPTHHPTEYCYIHSLERPTNSLLLFGPAGPIHHPTGEYCYTITRKA